MQEEPHEVELLHTGKENYDLCLVNIGTTMQLNIVNICNWNLFSSQVISWVYMIEISMIEAQESLLVGLFVLPYKSCFKALFSFDLGQWSHSQFRSCVGYWEKVFEALSKRRMQCDSKRVITSYGPMNTHNTSVLLELHISYFLPDYDYKGLTTSTLIKYWGAHQENQNIHHITEQGTLR